MITGKFREIEFEGYSKERGYMDIYVDDEIGNASIEKNHAIEIIKHLSREFDIDLKEIGK